MIVAGRPAALGGKESQGTKGSERTKRVKGQQKLRNTNQFCFPVLFITFEPVLTAPLSKICRTCVQPSTAFYRASPHPVIYMSEILQGLELRAQAQGDADQATPVVDMPSLLKQLLTFPRPADGIVPDTWGTDKRADVKRITTDVDSVYALSRGYHSTR